MNAHPEPVERLARIWGRAPNGVALGTTQGGVSAALWSVQVKGTIELTGDADAANHIVSLCVGGKHQKTYWGDDKVRIDGPNGPGRLNLVPSGERPRAVQVATGVVSYLHIYVPAAYLQTLAEAALVARPERLELVQPRCGYDPNIEQIGREIITELGDLHPLSRLRVDTLGQDLAIQLLRRHCNLAGTPKVAFAPARGGLAPWQVRRACDYLQANLERDVSLAELAALTGLSPHHFCRAFKQSTGASPHAWFTQRRIERAQEIIAADLSIGLTEVAMSVGFGSQSAFGTAFRRITGTTPSTWRRERLS